MSVGKALQAAAEAGVEIELDGEDLLLTCAVQPPRGVIDLLARHKSGLVAHLRALLPARSATEWRALFDDAVDRAMAQRGLSRGDAEAGAFVACIITWLDGHPEASDPDRCLACGGGDRIGAPVLPFGPGRAGYQWVHAECWGDWHAARRRMAARALTSIGLPAPAEFADDFGKTEIR